MNTQLTVARKSDIDEQESISDLVLYTGTFQGCMLFILANMLSDPNVKDTNIEGTNTLTWEIFNRKIENYEIYCGFRKPSRYNDIDFITGYMSSNNFITK